ncbi:hypothetical protein C8T65DRAFT_742254 [Cerioporus squamosus]|nr:hypothetical protein C8T65DRAFT_742254 [Cerioporus squamosus]
MRKEGQSYHPGGGRGAAAVKRAHCGGVASGRSARGDTQSEAGPSKGGDRDKKLTATTLELRKQFDLSKWTPHVLGTKSSEMFFDHLLPQRIIELSPEFDKGNALCRTEHTVERLLIPVLVGAINEEEQDKEDEKEDKDEEIQVSEPNSDSGSEELEDWPKNSD